MTAPDEQADDWREKEKQREERMRYQVLHMLYESANRCADFEISVGGFVSRLGVWRDQLFRTLAYLDAEGYIRYSETAEGASVCLTVKGVDYIEVEAGRRRSIRDDQG